MQIVETEYLKPCPFCGGKPILRVMDNNSHNGMVTTEIRCEDCRSTGKTVVSFNHSAIVGRESHNRIIREVTTAWNRRAEVLDSRNQLLDICDTLLGLCILLEKGQRVIQGLISDYFSDSVEKHEKTQGVRLLGGYDNARIFADIADDYTGQALQMADKLMHSIDLGEKKPIKGGDSTSVPVGTVESSL